MQRLQTTTERKQSCSCLWRLWFSFDDGPLRLLCPHWECFYWLGLDVDVLCLACGTCLFLALVQAPFLDLQLQPCTLFPLFFLSLMSALHLSGLILLRLLLKKTEKGLQLSISMFCFFYKGNSEMDLSAAKIKASSDIQVLLRRWLKVNQVACRVTIP